MIVKVSILVVLAFLQASEVLSQQQQQPLGYGGYAGQQGMNPSQMWDPSSWATPYYAAASNSWMDYIKMAQEAGKQLYQQWDKTGAADMFGTGGGLVQQSTQQADMATKEAAKVAQQAAKMGMDFAKQFFG